MKQFIVTCHAPVDAAWRTAESSPEEMEAGMKAWMARAQKCGDRLKDFGTPLGNALELLKDHPHLDWNAACEIEVHESLPVPGS